MKSLFARRVLARGYKRKLLRRDLRLYRVEMDLFFYGFLPIFAKLNSQTKVRTLVGIVCIMFKASFTLSAAEKL